MRFLAGSLALSVLLHLGLTLFYFARSPAAPSSDTDATVVYVHLGSLGGGGNKTPDAQVGKSHSSRAARQNSPSAHSAPKLFAMTTQQVWGTPAEGPSGLVTRGGPGAAGGFVGIEVQGDPQFVPLMQKLAAILHESLSFTRELYDLHRTGTVEAHFSLTPEGQLDETSVAATGEEKYLLVYVVQRLDQLMGQVPRSDLANSAAQKPKIRVTVRFLSGRDPSYTHDPLPVVKRDDIEMERRRRAEMAVGVGPTKVYLDNVQGAAAGVLSMNLDLESLFSGSHRKVHGLSGTKNIQRQGRALRTVYDRLWAHYRARGWIR